MDKIMNGQNNQKKRNYDDVIELGVVNSQYTNSYRGMDKISINECIKKIKNDVLVKLNIPEHFKDVSFDNFNIKENQNNAKEIKLISENGFVDNKQKNIGMFFWNTKEICGVGKTHLAYASLKNYALSDKNIKVDESYVNSVVVSYVGKSIKVLSEYELIDLVRSTYKINSEISEEDVFEKLNKYQILCIDSVLYSVPANPEFYQKIMFRLIEDRYKTNKSLILISNQPLFDMSKYFGISLTNKFHEMTRGYQFQFKGDSQRAK